LRYASRAQRNDAVQARPCRPGRLVNFGREIVRASAIAAAILLAVPFVGPAQAQKTDQPAGPSQPQQVEPLYETVDLNTGFLPDPQSVELLAGGPNQASNMAGPDCRGYINEERPDVRLNFNAGSFPMNIYAVSEADLTLVVRLPDGSWACNDDTQGFNPAVSVQPAQSGAYDIWVGTYSQGSTPEATLFISELSPQWPNQAGPGGQTGQGQFGPGGQGPGQPDVMADPMFGTVNLNTGYTPDPHTVQVQAGGPNEASPLGPNCRGYINNAQPDVRLNFQAGSYPMNIYVTSQADTTLAVNLPNGQWVCNDDANGLDPWVQVQPAQSGQYDIWVGTYQPGSTPPAQVHISELAPQW
jgi:hypothetical protein